MLLLNRTRNHLRQLRPIRRALKNVRILAEIIRPQKPMPWNRMPWKIITRPPTPRLPTNLQNRRQIILMIIRKHMRSQCNLPKVIRAINPLGRRFCLAQSRKKQRRQDADNGNHHQQLDQRKSPVSASLKMHFHTPKR